MSVKLGGVSSAGKNRTVETVLGLLPERAVYKLTAASPKLLAYVADSQFKHRLIYLAEAASLSDTARQGF